MEVVRSQCSSDNYFSSCRQNPTPFEILAISCAPPPSSLQELNLKVFPMHRIFFVTSCYSICSAHPHTLTSQFLGLLDSSVFLRWGEIYMAHEEGGYHLEKLSWTIHHRLKATGIKLFRGILLACYLKDIFILVNRSYMIYFATGFPAKIQIW